METKIKYKVEERTYRNNMGQLHIGYITRLLVGKKIDETAFAAALGKATNMSAPKVNYIMMETAEYVMRRLFEGSSVSVPKLGTFKLAQKPCSDTKAAGWCIRYGFNHHQISTVR